MGPHTNSIYIVIMHISHSNTAPPFLWAAPYACWHKYRMNWSQANTILQNWSLGQTAVHSQPLQSFTVFVSPASSPFTNHTHRNPDTVVPESTALVTMSPLAKISCCDSLWRAGKQQEGGAELSVPPNLSMAWWLSSARFRPGCGLPLPKGVNGENRRARRREFEAPVLSFTNCALPRDP